MTALELFDLRKRNVFTRGAALAAEQHGQVARKVQMRTVTTMLLSSAANVLGNGERPAPTRSLAGMMNGVTRWHNR